MLYLEKKEKLPLIEVLKRKLAVEILQLGGCKSIFL